MNKDFKFFEPTNNGIIIFYDNFQFIKYRIDASDYSISNIGSFMREKNDTLSL